MPVMYEAAGDARYRNASAISGGRLAGQRDARVPLGLRLLDGDCLVGCGELEALPAHGRFHEGGRDPVDPDPVASEFQRQALGKQTRPARPGRFVP